MADTDLEEDMMLVSSWEEHYKDHLKSDKKKEFLRKFNDYIEFTHYWVKKEIQDYANKSAAEARMERFAEKVKKVHPTFMKSTEEIAEYNKKRKQRQNEILDGKPSIFGHFR